MTVIKRIAAVNNADKLAVITLFQNLYLYNHVSALYMQARGLTLLQVNSISSIMFAAIIVAEVPTGVIADRIGRKKSVVVALFLQFLGEVFFLFAKNFPAFVSIAVLGGIGYSFMSGANEALIYDSLPLQDRENRMKQAMGAIGGTYQLAFFIAPLLGGWVISKLVTSRYLLGIGLTALSVFVACLLSLSLKEPEGAFRRAPENPLGILRRGLSQIRRNRKVRWIAAVAVFTGAFSNTLVNFYQPYFVEFGLNTSMPMGVALSLGGLTAFLIQRNIAAIENRLGKFALAILSIVPGLLYVLFALTTRLTALIPVFVLTYAFTDAKNPLVSAYQNEHIESRSRATTISLINMARSLYVAAMGIFLGWIANSSIPAVFLVIGAIVILSTLLLRVDKMTSGI